MENNEIYIPAEAQIPFGCYYIEREYLDYLREHGNEHVPKANYEDEGRCQKFYCGPVMTVDAVNYYVPVSSQIREMRLNNIETYGITLRDTDNKPIGCLDFRYMVPCHNTELLTPCLLEKHGAKQANFCIQNQEKVCKEANATYKNIISNDYPWLTKESIDFENAISSMWDYDDERMSRRVTQAEILSKNINTSCEQNQDSIAPKT